MNSGSYSEIDFGFANDYSDKNNDQENDSDDDNGDSDRHNKSGNSQRNVAVNVTFAGCSFNKDDFATFEVRARPDRNKGDLTPKCAPWLRRQRALPSTQVQGTLHLDTEDLRGPLAYNRGVACYSMHRFDSRMLRTALARRLKLRSKARWSHTLCASCVAARPPWISAEIFVLPRPVHQAGEVPLLLTYP